MKRSDAPADVVKELAVRRAWRRDLHGWPIHPADGALWFDDGCAVCGGLCEGDMDHCHTTGLYRGQLCHPCNLSEGFHNTPVWEYWRLNAPGLEQRHIHNHGDRSIYLTSEEVLTLPMAELFAIHEECEEIWRRGSAERVRAAMAPMVERFRRRPETRAS